MPTLRLMMPFLASLALLAGCGTSDTFNQDGSGVLDTASSYGTQTGSAASTPGLMVDAAVQTILDAGAGGDVSARSISDAPRLAARGTQTLTVTNLKLPDGSAMFPNATGSLSVTWTGQTINSWPATTVQSINASVTVTTSNLTYTDSTSGTTVTVSGTLSFDLDGTLSGTNRFNWTSDLTSVMSISSTSPLTASVTRNGSTDTVKVSGNRTVQHVATSTESSSATTQAGRTGTRSFTRTIRGSASNPAGTSDGLTYSSITAQKTVSGLGTVTVIWNRSAQYTGIYDFNVGTDDVVTTSTVTTTPTGSPTQVYDRTYLTLKLNAVTMSTVGPKTTADMASYISSSASGLNF